MDKFKFFPIEVCFTKTHKELPSSVSKYLRTLPTETSNQPVYYHFKNVAFQGKNYTGLYYIFFYAVNPGYEVCCVTDVGQHPADVERIVVLFDNISYQPKWVFFGAHGNGQGEWVPWNKCCKTEDGILRVFVSPTSNGFYAKERTYHRALCMANDSTVGVDHCWRPTQSNFQKSWEQSWSNSHYQVARGINNPRNVPDPESRSVTFNERFCLPLPHIRKRLSKVPKVATYPLDMAFPN